MGYPIRYRGGRSPRTGSRSIPLGDLPPGLGLGPFAGIAVASWAFTELATQLSGWSFLGNRQTPATYGWTLTTDCGRPPLRLPGAAWGACSTSLIVSKVSWEASASQNPMSPSVMTLYYWARAGRFNQTLSRYENCETSQRWDRGAGANFAPYTAAPAAPQLGGRPGVLLGGPLLSAGSRLVPAEGSVRGYDVDRAGGRFTETVWRDTSLTTYLPGTYVPSRPRVIPGTRPINVPRAIPYPNTMEQKFAKNSKLNNAFLALYQGFNFLGDTLAFVRAMWFSLRGRKGRSMHLGAMLRDLWKNPQNIDWNLALYNVALWKLQDATFGSQQMSTFEAIGSRYGYNAARTWSTLDSAIRQSTGRLERTIAAERGSPTNVRG